MTESSELSARVIENGYCIGCGACASVTDSPFVMRMDEYGNIVATAAGNTGESHAEVLDVCPFSDRAASEDKISDELFPSAVSRDRYIGKYIDCYAG
ncbi:MAG: hypothetical protein ACLFN1_10965, partial [Bacteroidales bacterium]